MFFLLIKSLTEFFAAATVFASVSVIALTALLDANMFDDVTTGLRMLLLPEITCVWLRVRWAGARVGWTGVSGGVSGLSILTCCDWLRKKPSICSRSSFSDCCTIAAASIKDGGWNRIRRSHEIIITSNLNTAGLHCNYCSSKTF